jgi:predicted metal-dependent enzyme (double-stranded beta helix superfamily)
MVKIEGRLKLRRFIADMTLLVHEAHGDEPMILEKGRRLMADLISADDWLPHRFSEPNALQYRQYLLHCDPLGRFSVVSFVWGPGQSTPIHDHTTWGIVGVLRGAELSQGYDLVGGVPVGGKIERLEKGEVACVSPIVGDIHKVFNALDDRASISIHVYGGNIGEISRHVYDDEGRVSSFVSGYHNDMLPNLWVA